MERYKKGKSFKEERGIENSPGDLGFILSYT